MSKKIAILIFLSIMLLTFVGCELPLIPPDVAVDTSNYTREVVKENEVPVNLDYKFDMNFKNTGGKGEYRIDIHGKRMLDDSYETETLWDEGPFLIERDASEEFEIAKRTDLDVIYEEFVIKVYSINALGREKLSATHKIDAPEPAEGEREEIAVVILNLDIDKESNEDGTEFDYEILASLYNLGDPGSYNWYLVASETEITENIEDIDYENDNIQNGEDVSFLDSYNEVFDQSFSSSNDYVSFALIVESIREDSPNLLEGTKLNIGGE